MERNLRAVSAALALLLTTPAVATTVIEKDLNALCDEADRVFVGTVKQVSSRWRDAGQHTIETLVTFSDVEPLYGSDGRDVTLRFAGGEIGDVVESIAGMPRFNVGERAVIFARDAAGVSPLVGFHQGGARIAGSGGEATVETTTYERVGELPNGRAVLGERIVRRTSVPLASYLDTVRARLALRNGAAR
jgi:hypothetical protein